MYGYSMPIVTIAICLPRTMNDTRSYYDNWLANIFKRATSIAIESIQGAYPICYFHNTRVSEYWVYRDTPCALTPEPRKYTIF